MKPTYHMLYVYIMAIVITMWLDLLCHILLDSLQVILDYLVEVINTHSVIMCKQ